MIHSKVPHGISDEEEFLGLMKKSYLKPLKPCLPRKERRLWNQTGWRFWPGRSLPKIAD
jgi:hypothetical protein